MKGHLTDLFEIFQAQLVGACGHGFCSWGLFHFTPMSEAALSLIDHPLLTDWATIDKRLVGETDQSTGFKTRQTFSPPIGWERI